MGSGRLSIGEGADGATNAGAAPLLAYIGGKGGRGGGVEQRVSPQQDEADHQQGGDEGVYGRRAVWEGGNSVSSKREGVRGVDQRCYILLVVVVE